jgi:hypothetical protein
MPQHRKNEEISMKTILIAVALAGAVSVHAFAQTTTTDGNTPAIADPGSNSGVLVEGKNSFTESQAKERIAEAGYTDVGALKLDDKGIWRTTASKDGKSVDVGLDYQGNVVAK